MLTNCVNPACRTPFSHSQGGRFFTVDRDLTAHAPQAAENQHEQFWLCGTCSKSFKIAVEDGRVTTIPIDVETASIAG